MSGASNWPPSLKKFVNETFAGCTASNKAAVEAELKQAIFKAFESNQLWTIDWPNYKLKALNPKKRFLPSTPATNGVKAGLSSSGGGVDDDDRRAKRAMRFVNQAEGTTSTGGSLGDRLGLGNSQGASFGRVAQAGKHGYGGSKMYATPEPAAVYDPNVIDWDKHTIVGTSTKLEKPYLRLTEVPNPANIRPLPILKQTLELLKRKWSTEQNYAYICDQFQSVRQDLTVQRIKNDFTCQVYEIHARIALEKGDLGEFNKCQAQLRELYKQGLKGQRLEFLGYRLLYLVYSRNRAELNATMAGLTDAERLDESVAHALQVRLAASQGNYTRLFRLFHAAPKMGAYLMDHFVGRERVAAMVVMARAYVQGLPLAVVTRQLGFDGDAEAVAFLAEHKADRFRPAPAGEQGIGREPVVDSKVAGPRFVEAMASLSKVDLKGQI